MANDNSPETAYKEAHAMMHEYGVQPPQLKKSINLFQEIIRKFPDYAPAYTSLAFALAELSGKEDCSKIFCSYSLQVLRENLPLLKKAAALDPDYYNTYDILFLFYEGLEDIPNMKVTLDRADEIDPNDVRTDLMNAKYAFWIKDYDNAQKFAQKIVDGLEKGRYAEKYFRLPDHYGFFYSRASELLTRIAYAKKDYDMAVKVSRRMIEMPFDYYYAEYSKGFYAKALLVDGDFDAAIKLLEPQTDAQSYVGDKEVLAQAYLTKARNLLETEGKFKDIIVLAQKMIDLDENQIYGYLILAVGQISAGNEADALKAYSIALKLKGATDERGLAYLRDSLMKASAFVLDELVRVNSENKNTDTLNLLASVYRIKADEMLRESRDTSPLNALIFLEKANAISPDKESIIFVSHEYLLKNMPRKAVRILEKAVQDYPDDETLSRLFNDAKDAVARAKNP